MPVKEYEISTLNDILAIPDDKIDSCIEQMAKMIHAVKPMYDLLDAMGEEDKDIIQLPMIYKPDGKKEVTINVNVAKQEA